MNHQRENRRAGRVLGLARRVARREGGESGAVCVSERSASGSSEQVSSPTHASSTLFLERRRESRASAPSSTAFPVFCQSFSEMCSASSWRDTQGTLRECSPRKRRHSPRLLVFLYCLVLQCLASASVDARLVVIYPDTLTTYPPILETYFAPWSLNFTSVSGRLRYFSKTCDLEHYFYSDVSELEADPVSLFKELHALQFFPPDQASPSVSRLTSRGGGRAGEGLKSRGDTHGDDLGLIRGTFRRLQEALLSQSLTSFPWRWVNTQEAEALHSSETVARAVAHEEPFSEETNSGNGAHLMEATSGSEESTRREGTSPTEHGEDTTGQTSHRGRRLSIERLPDSGQHDSDRFSRTDIRTTPHTLPSPVSSSDCPGCSESVPSRKTASLTSQSALSALPFFGDAFTYTPLSLTFPAAHYVLSRRGFFAGGSEGNRAFVADASRTPAFLLPIQNNRLPPSVADADERKRSVTEMKNRDTVDGKKEPSLRSSSVLSSVLNTTTMFSSSVAPSVSKRSSVSSRARQFDVAASTIAALSPGITRFFGPSSQGTNGGTASPAAQETPVVSSLSSLPPPHLPTKTDVETQARTDDASPPTASERDFQGVTGKVNTDTSFLNEEDASVRLDLGTQVLWFFDQCNNPEDVERLVHAANTNGVGALIFTNTTFSDYTEKRPTLSSLDGWKKLVTSVPGAPQPAIPVLSVPDTRLSREIKERLRAGDIVEVDIDMLPADYVNCAVLQPVKWFSLLFIPLWGAVTLLWYTMCNYVRTYDVSPLHRLLLLPPLLKTMFMVTAFGFYAQCPNYLGSSTQYIMMAYMGLNTIFNTIFYGILLLLAKGFMVTREAFGRKESLSLAVLVSLVYIVTSINQVEEAETLPALLCLYVALMITVLMSAARNVRHLELRLAYVRLVQVQDWEEALNVKLKMFRNLYRFSAAFFLLQISQKIILFEVFDRQDLSEIACTALEWIFFIGVAAVFRPREEIRYFSLMQRTPEIHTILPMYAAGPYVARGTGVEERVFEEDLSASLLPSESSEPPPSVWTRLKAFCCSIFAGPSGIAGERETSGLRLEDGVAVESLAFRGRDERPQSGSPIVIINPAADEEEATGYLSLHNLAVGTLVPTPKKYSPDGKRCMLSTSSERNRIRRTSLSSPSNQSGESRPPSVLANGDSTPPESNAETRS